MREQILKALKQHIFPNPSANVVCDVEGFEDAATAILALIAPAGWKLVPIEPTEEMLKAACERALSFEVLMDDTRFACDRASYAAAIAAAPEPPTEQ